MRESKQLDPAAIDRDRERVHTKFVGACQKGCRRRRGTVVDADVAASCAGREEHRPVKLGDGRELGKGGRHDGRVGGRAEHTEGRGAGASRGEEGGEITRGDGVANARRRLAPVPRGRM